jgi:hypothetical protein
VNFDQDFAGADLGNRDRFEANVVHAAIHGGQHGRGNFLRKPIGSQLLRNSHIKV